MAFAAVSTLLVSSHSVAGEAYQQQAGDTNNIVSMQTEEFSDNVAQGNHTWSPSYPAGHSGTAAMEAAPNGGTNNNSNYLTNSPRMDYQIKFIKAGTYFIWVSGLGASGRDDSLHVGLNGIATASSERMSIATPTVGWNNRLMGGAVAKLEVPAAGEHTLNLWMREDGVVVDKVVLTTNSGYAPWGAGPATTPREVAATPGNLPINLTGSTPEQAAIEHNVALPSDAQTATVTLTVYDADFPDEGELVINGNAPVTLFGDQSSGSNDGQTGPVTFTMPASYWRDGNNNLVFHHIRTVGFTVDDIDVTFDGGSSGGSEGSGSSGASGGSANVQLDLNASTPEQTTNLNVAKPTGTSATALITLEVYDPDFSDEGELIINGNAPIMLFGDAGTSANDGISATVTLNAPAAYWRDGDNTLVFKHTSTYGYGITHVKVEFSGPGGGTQPANNPPRISGTPATSATVGENYAFQPTASDPEGDALSFSIVNKPSWAAINQSTGRLSGTPGAGDEGRYGNIRVTVSDGTQSDTLATFTIDVTGGVGTPPPPPPANTGSVMVNWDIPTNRSDGSSMSSAEITGYTLYYGSAPNQYTESIFISGGNQTSVTLDNRQPGETIHMVITAWDDGGQESHYSNAAVVTVN